MNRIVWLLVGALALGTGPTADARSLRDTLRDASTTVGIRGGDAFDELADAIADTAARSLPVFSASAGRTYSYNPELEIFEQSSDTLGPLFLERPDTIGQGKINLNASFQYVQFDEYDGQSLRSLSNGAPIITTGGPVALEYSLGIQNYITALSGTYGILDNLDVNVLVPLISTNFDVGVSANSAHGHLSEDAFGLGDILLRFKYRLSDFHGIRSALGVVFRMPTGDEDDFQGTGAFEASPSFYASMLIGERVHPHVNVAIDVRPEEAERSQARYGIGADIDVMDRLGVSLAFLGRSEFSESARFRDTAFLHAGGQQLPLLGVEFDRKDYFDVAFGVRAVIWRDIMLFANVLRALNDDGLRNDTVIPSVGIEGTF